MDRAAKLAEQARESLKSEVNWSDFITADENRRITRDTLAWEARRLGFSSLEISAAVDQALTDAGTTP